MDQQQQLTDTAPARDRVAVAQRAVWLGYGLLVLEQLPVNPWAVLPLLLFLPGLRRQDWRTAIWLCFVLLVYFMVNVTHLFRPERNWLDYMELVTTVALFIAAMLFARWQRQPRDISQLRAQLPDQI